MFELAKHRGNGPTTISRIARAQAIPAKFLELILGELRQGGFVSSRRGRAGGYFMVTRPADLSVGRVIRFIDGPIAPVKCLVEPGEENCPLQGACAFADMWKRAQSMMAEVYDSTTFEDLMEAETAAISRASGDYMI